MKHSEEQKLLKQAANGSGQAFSELVETYYMTIYSIAFKWTGNRYDAEDIAQEVCIKIGRAIRGFRKECKFSTWIYRIVLNTVKDFKRQCHHDRHLDHLPESNATNDKTIEIQVEIAELWQFVNQLPDRQRDAILLVYAEDLTHREVAIIMECKESTVSWYIHEAKKQLKTLIDHDGR